MATRIAPLVILVIFATIALALPFALSTCGSTGGVFCGLSGHAATDADCTPHAEIHFGLLAQFKRCAPEKVAFASLLMTLVVMMIALMISAVSLLYPDAQARIAEAAYTYPHTTMNPFDHLRLALARGITHARKNVHTIPA